MRTAVVLIGCTAATFVFVIAAGLAWSAEPSEVVVEVGPLKNLKGVVRCQIFDKANGFPSEPDKALAKQHHQPSSNTVRCRFAGLNAGTYAVSALHDEDDNGEMNTNFIGVPDEGYGATNNKLPSMSAPSFVDSSFKLAPAEKKTLKVSLKY